MNSPTLPPCLPPFTIPNIQGLQVCSSPHLYNVPSFFLPFHSLLGSLLPDPLRPYSTNLTIFRLKSSHLLSHMSPLLTIGSSCPLCISTPWPSLKTTPCNELPVDHLIHDYKTHLTLAKLQSHPLSSSIVFNGFLMPPKKTQCP